MSLREFNTGKIVGFLKIDRHQFSENPVFSTIELWGDSVAIMGLNGSGKTTYLKRFADTLVSKGKFSQDGDEAKYWTGGFIFSPDGMKDDLNEIFKPHEHSHIGGQSYDDVDQSIRKQIVNGEDLDLFNYVNGSTTKEEHLVEIRKRPHFLKARYLIPEHWPISKIDSILENWSPNYYPDLAKEIINQNRFVAIFHAEDKANNIDRFDMQKYPTRLVCRMIEVTEDTSTARVLIERIKKSLLEIGKLESISYHEMLSQILTGKENVSFAEGTNWETPAGDRKFKRDIMSLPGNENPLLTPFLFHYGFIANDLSDEDWPEYCSDWSENLGQTFLEWPQWRFQPRDILDSISGGLVSAAVDPSLLHNTFHADASDFERIVQSCANVNLDLNMKRKPENFQTAEINAQELLEKAEKVLKEWQVTPYSKTEGIAPKDSEVYKMAWNFKFKNGHLIFDWDSELNESTKRWIYRAIQVAGMLDVKTPYRIVIWDEPEFGLHPSAILNVKRFVLPFLNRNSIKVIFTTHSTVLGNSAQQILSCQREQNYPHDPVLKSVPAINESVLEDLGITKFDLLSSIRKILIVEGDHDKFVLETVFGDALDEIGVRVFTLGGTHQLLGLPQSQLIVEFLDVEIFILTDGLNRSIFNSNNRKYLDEISAAITQGDLKSAYDAIFSLERAGYDKNTEIAKLIPVLKTFLSMAKKDFVIQRVNFLMLKKNDILHYLDPKIAIGRLDVSRYSSWEDIWASRKASSRKARNEKEFIREELGGDIGEKSIKKASKALLDRPLNAEFQALFDLLSEPRIEYR